MSRVFFHLILPWALLVGIPAVYRAGQRAERAAATRHERTAVDFAIAETLRRSADPRSPARPAPGQDDGENR